MTDLPIGDNNWMVKFNELQKRQVDALVLQNENQKLQLEILSLQLKVENKRKTHMLLNELEGARLEIGGTVQPQQESSSLGQTSLNPVPEFVMHAFGSNINQGFTQCPNYNLEGSQNSNILPEENRDLPEIQQQQQSHTMIGLPEITNLDVADQHQRPNVMMDLPDMTSLDAVDSRLMMALCYNMPPPPLQTPMISDPFTPTNKRIENQGNCVYAMTPDNLTPLETVKAHRHGHRRPSTIRTPVSPIESPRVKRARTSEIGIGYSDYSPNILGGFNGDTDQRGPLSEALRTYASDVEKLAFVLTRKDLEECVLELALAEEGIANLVDDSSTSGAIHIPSGGLVRSALLKRCNKNGRKVVFNKDIYPMSMGLNEGSNVGAFKNLPLEPLIHIVTFLPLGAALKFILSVCKSFRRLMSEPILWNKMVIELKNQELSSDGFVRLIRTLPETSIRYFSIDTANYDIGVINEVIELLIKGKQFGLTSLHISGKKLSLATIFGAVKRLWADKITVFSLTDVTHTKVDPEQTIKQVLSLMPNLKKLRMEGGSWDIAALRSLSCLHGQLRNIEGSRLVGDNRLTHISFSGSKTMICWDNLKDFGKWFPEIEELFIQCVYANETEWIRNYADGPAKFGVEGVAVAFEGAKYKYRTPNYVDISWVPMSRLKYFGCGSICEQTKKHQVKAFEDIHAAYVWSLLRGSRETLERLELSRGQETFKERGKGNGKFHAPLPQLIPVPLRGMHGADFPKLTYLFLGFWDIHWEWFTAFKSSNDETTNLLAEAPGTIDGLNGSTPISTPILGFEKVKKFIFWGCTGIPKDQNTTGGKSWVRDLKKTWGEDLEAIDEAIGQYEALKGNKGMGSW